MSYDPLNPARSGYSFPPRFRTVVLDDLRGSGPNESAVMGTMFWGRREAPLEESLKAVNFVPPILIFLGGGPGLSGGTVAPVLGPHLELADIMDYGYYYMPESNLANIRHLYDALIRQIWRLTKHTVRSADQEIILVGHSYGGIQATDLVIYNQSLPENDRLNIKVLSVIASPLSKFLHEEVIPQMRREKLPAEYNNAWEAYLSDPTDKNYTTLVKANDYLIFSSDSRLKSFGERIVGKYVVSPEALILVKKHWGKANEWQQKVREIKEVMKVGLFGEHDILLPANLVEDTYEELGFKSVKVEGGSHFPFIENWEAHRRVYMGFYYESVQRAQFAAEKSQEAHN